ncbi:MAG: phosphoenolpyruvate--protein phosphotransferase [Candidatus Omnitrophica bacterium]|nr:phosphoenolpyruvate--protein phosphotransferase [Candidatus Omnitrophota bacterium]MBU1925867.1 phosphoenolpyruvate--protein phosphotransferase [Candidatus Omnitrophota bacterium]
MLKGIAASPGIAIGRAFVWDSEDYTITKHKIDEKDIPIEIARFEEALIKTRSEILEIQKKISKEMGVEHAEIFNAHLMVLEDRTLLEEVISKIKKEKANVEHSFFETLKKYADIFSKMDDEYLRERLVDVQDVSKRVIRNLLGEKKEELAELKEKIIIIATNLSPSDTALIQKEKVVGFATDMGGRTSHTVILARSLEIPAVVGLKSVTTEVKNGDIVIIDGSQGVIIINPNKQVISRYLREKRKFKIFEKNLSRLKSLPAVTEDGRTVVVAANIEFPEELASVLSHGAQGIGLYRTEYMYLNRTDIPTEEEHFQAYKKVALSMKKDPVVIRTMDIGGDKFVSHLDIPNEMNPLMGRRAIRFCLARPDIFKTQLRGILRASVYGNLKIMYPMISGLDELRQANKLLEEAKLELKKKKISFDKNIEVGIMIEVPSAGIIADILAKEVSFFSIGTNDLIQYSLAVDRINEKIAYLYEPAHPAVMRFIKSIIDAGHSAGIWVGMCGEMASEPVFALILLGLGLDEFSASAVSVPEIKKVIRSVSYKEARSIANKVLELDTATKIEQYGRAKLKELLIGKK